MQKPTKPFNWSTVTEPTAKIMNEEAGVKTPAEAKQKKKPYWINRNGELLDANNADHWQSVTKRQDAEAKQVSPYSNEAKAKLKKLKSTKPVQINFSNDSALKDLEELHRTRIEADARARRYNEYIKKTQDPDLHRGLAAVLGSIPQDFKK